MVLGVTVSVLCGAYATDDRPLADLHRRLVSMVTEADIRLADGRTQATKAQTDRVVASHRAEDIKRQNIDKLMKEFNTLYKEGKYLEAESLAMRALELDADNAVVAAAVALSVGLGGCFLSQQPLFPEASAVAAVGDGGHYLAYEKIGHRYKRDEAVEFHHAGRVQFSGNRIIEFRRPGEILRSQRHIANHHPSPDSIL